MRHTLHRASSRPQPTPARAPRRRLACTAILLAAVVPIPSAARAQIIGELKEVYVSPSLPTTQDDVALESLTLCSNPFPPPTIVGQTITLSTTGGLITPPCAAGLPPLFTSFPLGKLTAGSYTARVVVDGNPVYTIGFQVGAPATAIDLATGRFRVRVTRPADCGGPGCIGGLLQEPLTRTSDDSAYAWFYDSSNVEVTVKLLDGRALNGHFWVFIASMTDRPFIVTVTDLHTPSFCADPAGGEPLFGRTPCVTRNYGAVAGTNRNFIDLDHLGP
jgi:hypothetical protein